MANMDFKFKDYITEARVKQLKLMHELIMSSNDEEGLDWWLMEGVPDEPDEEDYRNIAEDSEYYYECVRIFKTLINHIDWEY